MDRLERLAVHMREAVRLSKSPGIEHQRLALILFDNAAELVMHRRCEELLWYEHYDFRELVNLERLQAWRPEEYKNSFFDARIASLKEKTTSKRRRGKISRDFSEKVRFLTESDDLEQPYAQVLDRLHAYRNEAYHRDQVRPATLSSAVEIYAYVACHMMETITPGAVIGFQGSLPAELAEFETLLADTVDAFDVQPKVARRLLEFAGLSGVEPVADALATNMIDRLDAIDGVLEELSGAWPERGWTRGTVMIQLQLEDTPDNALLSVAEVAKRSVPFGLGDLVRWRGEAERVRNGSDILISFGRFAAFEQEFEALEAHALAALRDFEEFVNLEIERRRGN